MNPAIILFACVIALTVAAALFLRADHRAPIPPESALPEDQP